MYTWFRRKPQLNASRIDYFLISTCLLNKTKETSIDPCTLSDHNLISIKIETNSPRRGPGMWQFNNKVLNDEVFIRKMCEKIRYTLSVYHYMEVIELWELLKAEMVTVSKKYCKKHVSKRKVLCCNLYKNLENLQNEMLSSTTAKDNDLDNAITSTQAAIDSSLEDKAKSSAFLAKSRFVHEGERNTKYFFSMGKKRIY